MRVTVNHPSWNIGFYWKMTRRCVAAGCSNSHKDGYSLYTFPKDLKIRRHWVKFVRMRRAKWPGPSKYSYLCSAHFGPESFSHPPYHRYRSFQINFRNDLKPDAIPTRYSADATDDPVKVDPSSPVFSITSTTVLVVLDLVVLRPRRNILLPQTLLLVLLLLPLGLTLIRLM